MPPNPPSENPILLAALLGEAEAEIAFLRQRNRALATLAAGLRARLDAAPAAGTADLTLEEAL